MPGTEADGSDGIPALSLAVLVAIAVALLVGGLVAVGSGPLAGSQPGATATPSENGGTTDGTGPGDGGEGGDTSSGDAGDDAGPTTPEPWADADPLEGTRSLSDARTTVAGSDGDELGFAVAVGDVNDDGRPDVVLGAPLHNASGPRSGAVAVFFGPVAAGDTTVEDADVWLPGDDARDWAGNSLALADVDADGVDDLVIGAPRNDAGGQNAGAVHVVHGGADLEGEVPLASADATVVGSDRGAWVGYSVAAGNLTGGPGADVVAGAPQAGDARGAVHVVDGDRIADGVATADADATFRGEAADDEAGWSVAVAGDVTGDGRTEVAVGARRNGAAGDDAGAAYVVAGPYDGERSLADAALVRRGPSAGAMAGWSVAGVGDVDGDGAADVLVGAPLADPGGAAYLVTGDASSASLADARPIRAEVGGDRAGWVVAGPGDVTCDGTPDLLVGAPDHAAAGEQAGAVYLVAGDAAAGASADDPAALENATATLTGAEAGDQVGRATSIGAVRSENGTRLVVGAAFGEPPATAHVVDAGCPSG